jgi:hypothetical protein
MQRRYSMRVSFRKRTTRRKKFFPTAECRDASNLLSEQFDNLSDADVRKFEKALGPLFESVKAAKFWVRFKS